MAFAARGRHQQQQARQQQANGAAHQRRRMLVAELTKQNTADNARAAQNQQQNRGEIGAKARHNLHKRLNIAVGRVMGGDHNHRKQINAHQRRATHQQRQAFQRAGMFTRQCWQQLDEADQRDQRPHADGKEGGTPAEVLPDNAANRQAEHHRQRGTGGNQAQRLRAFPRRCKANSERRGNRPEHRVGKGNTDAANDQHRKIPRHE